MTDSITYDDTRNLKQQIFRKSLFEYIPVDDPELGKFHTNKYSVITYGGAIRGGKTFAGLAMLILMCKVFPGSRWVVVRRSIEDLRKTTLPSFFKLYPRDKLKQVPNQSNGWVAILKNPGSLPDSEIMFFSENYERDKELNRWRGLEYNGIMLEEANELQFQTYIKALERMDSWLMGKFWRLNDQFPRVRPRFCIMTCNPAQNWMKAETYDKWKTETLPSDALYIRATVLDNPFIPKQWIEDKRRVMPPIQFQKFVEGDWEVSENDRPWAYSFDYDKHIYLPGRDGHAPDLNIDTDLPLWLSMDQNVEPPATVVGQKSRGWANLLDEVKVPKGSIYDVCSRIRYQYEGMTFRITGDASGNKREFASRNMSSIYTIVAEELGIDPHYDVYTPKSNMPLQNSRDLVNSVLYSHPYFKISRRCEKTLQDLQNARVDHTGDLEKHRKDPAKFMDHFDAARYMIHTWFPDWANNYRQYL